MICGLGGADMLIGLGKDDILVGGPGNDYLRPGSGRDRVLCGAGNDYVAARDGAADVVLGGPGRDRGRLDRRLDRMLSRTVSRPAPSTFPGRGIRRVPLTCIPGACRRRGRATRGRPSSSIGDVAVAAEQFERLRTGGLAEHDPDVAALLGRELERQRSQIELIASENFTWPAILEAVGSVPTNKYAEGYPGRRYYGGCEIVDEIEQLAIDRAKDLFGADHANVQPHAGAQANMAVYLGLLEPGDTVLSLRLDHGGHLTHGLKVNFSGRLYTIVHYGVSRETGVVDEEEVRALAVEHRPKLVLCGGSAYPRTVDTAMFRRVADEVGALLWCDMAHFAGLVAAGLHPNPVEHCDVVTSTTHKTLAGPRSGLILCREEHAQAIDRAIFPGLQGGPLEHVIAAKATCFKIAASEEFRAYQRQVRANADALAETLLAGGIDLLTGGTDTHLLQLDLRATEWSGKDAEERLHAVGLTTNRNTVPFDERPPTVASGVRLGSQAATIRGFDEEDFREVGRIVAEALGADADVDALRARSEALCARRPLYPGFQGYTTYVGDGSLMTETGVAVGTVTEVTHPLVQHKLGLLRDVTTTTQMFRQLVNELTLLLTYEATKGLADEEVEIETPLERTAARRISGKKVAVCPILRAGVGMLDAVLSLVPGARVGFIGLYRNEETLQPVEYYVKLPDDLTDRDVILLDPMLATGNSTAAAVETVKRAGATSVRLIALIAAPEGIERIHRDHPDVSIVVASIDRELNEKGYIVPGLGDAGDRLYGTK